MIIVYILIAYLLSYGLILILSSILINDRSFIGQKQLKQIEKRWKTETDIWDTAVLRKTTNFMAKYVYMEELSAQALAKQLARADIRATAEQFTARKYVTIIFCVFLAIICICVKFWLGIILSIALAVFLIMKQQELITAKLKAKDEAIAEEMPRFVRTICRNLRSNRDIQSIFISYRKIAGPVLGAELDILLMNMRTGGIADALQKFQFRLGTEEAYRLCGTLLEVERGIDQIATLDYLADDMARQAKYNVQKILSVRPAQLRRTYLPAIIVCVCIILYVFIVFAIGQLNNLF